MEAQTAERTFYEPFLDDSLNGLEGIDAESFIPSRGTILISIPPAKKMTDGGIHLVADAVIRSCVGRVVSVPGFHAMPLLSSGETYQGTDCPVVPGDLVIFQEGSGTPVAFNKRTDLALLQYTDGPDSEILGWVKP